MSQTESRHSFVSLRRCCRNEIGVEFVGNGFDRFFKRFAKDETSESKDRSGRFSLTEATPSAVAIAERPTPVVCSIDWSVVAVCLATISSKICSWRFPFSTDSTTRRPRLGSARQCLRNRSLRCTDYL